VWGRGRWACREYERGGEWGEGGENRGEGVEEEEGMVGEGGEE